MPVTKDLWKRYRDGGRFTDKEFEEMLAEYEAAIPFLAHYAGAECVSRCAAMDAADIRSSLLARQRNR